MNETFIEAEAVQCHCRARAACAVGVAWEGPTEIHVQLAWHAPAGSEHAWVTLSAVNHPALGRLDFLRQTPALMKLWSLKFAVQVLKQPQHRCPAGRPVMAPGAFRNVLDAPKHMTSWQ
jgi:hypothetical protein